MIGFITLTFDAKDAMSISIPLSFAQPFSM